MAKGKRRGPGGRRITEGRLIGGLRSRRLVPAGEAYGLEWAK